MNIELTEEIASVFQDFGRDDEVRSVVLTGDGKSFCAGVDLKIVPAFDQGGQRRMVNALNHAFYSVYTCPLPVVGAINGHAIAGGLVLALCCDWRMAATSSFLVGLTEVRVGVPYPVAAMEVARQELRPDAAPGWFCSARTWRPANVPPRDLDGAVFMRRKRVRSLSSLRKLTRRDRAMITGCLSKRIATDSIRLLRVR